GNNRLQNARLQVRQLLGGGKYPLNRCGSEYTWIPALQRVAAKLHAQIARQGVGNQVNIGVVDVAHLNAAIDEALICSKRFLRILRFQRQQHLIGGTGCNRFAAAQGFIQLNAVFVQNRLNLRTNLGREVHVADDVEQVDALAAEPAVYQLLFAEQPPLKCRPAFKLLGGEQNLDVFEKLLIQVVALSSPFFEGAKNELHDVAFARAGEFRPQILKPLTHVFDALSDLQFVFIEHGVGDQTLGLVK